MSPLSLYDDMVGEMDGISLVSAELITKPGEEAALKLDAASVLGRTVVNEGTTCIVKCIKWCVRQCSVRVIEKLTNLRRRGCLES